MALAGVADINQQLQHEVTLKKGSSTQGHFMTKVYACPLSLCHICLVMPQFTFDKTEVKSRARKHLQPSDSHMLIPAQQEILLKIKGSQELGAWATLTTICKTKLDIVPFAEAQSVKEHLQLSLRFTPKSGFGDAAGGFPQLTSLISAQMHGPEVDQTALYWQTCPAKVPSIAERVRTHLR